MLRFGSNTPVNYIAGLSGTNPLFTSGGVSINSSTGAISFTPNFVQVGVICVVVEEYRNGVKIGELIRDIQFNISNCGSNTAPTASGPYLYNTAPNQQICFNITGSDPNPGDLIKMSTNNGISGGTFSPSLPTGFISNPSTQFCWTPTLADQNQTHFFTITVQDDACPNAGINTYTYQVVVGSGCNAPDANCKNISVNLNANGTATISPASVNNNSTYDCGFDYWTISKSSFGCGDLGGNTVTLTIYDDEGNSDNCTSTVTVVDNSKPVPNMANLPTITGQCGASVSSPPTATDNCAGQVTATTTDPTSFNAQGTYYITWTYNDGNGNTETQTQTVIVDDTMKPVPDVANLPTITGQCSASVSAPPTATDNCAGQVTGTTNDPTSFNTQGTYYITWTYDDGNGNSETQTQTVIVDDTMNPIPKMAYLPTIYGQCSASATPPIAMDNCAGMITGTPNGPTSFNAQGTYAIIWTYDDLNGNTITQTQSVIVEDTTVPEISCPGNITKPSAPGVCGANVSFTVSASDNCGEVDYVCTIGGTGGVSLTEVESGDFFPVGTTTVTCTATDAKGLTASCSFDITVNDTEAPMLLTQCPGNITLCGAQIVSWTPPTPKDNCGVVQVINDYNPGHFFNVGTYTNNYTFLDAAGLSVSCSFTITINPKPEVTIEKSDLPEWCQGVQILTAVVTNQGALAPPLSFSWSTGANGTDQITAYSNGYYDVEVTDANGCTSTASILLDEDLTELLSAHTILIDDEMEMINSTVISGGVGVLDADEIDIEDNSDIQTFLVSDDANIDGSSTVADWIEDDSPLDLPDFMENNFNNYNNETVPDGGTMTLSGTNYGHIIVGEGATLNIDNGNMFVRQLTMEEGATINFNQPSYMMVRRDMRVHEFCSINVGGPTTVIFVEGEISIQEGSTVAANLYTEEGLEVNDSGDDETTYMIGLFIAEELESGDNVIWGWNTTCGQPDPCQEGQNLVTITINTDNFASETSWELLVNGSVAASGGENYASTTTYVEEICVDPGCYEFTIFDSFGDGICCGFGEGGYSVALNGQVVGSGAEFGGLETTVFGDCDADPSLVESIDPTIAESSITVKEGLTIFPNPTSGLFQVDVTNYEGKAIDVAIYDQLGREVWNYSSPEVRETVIQVDMTSGAFVNSLYLLQLRSEGQAEIEMFVLDKE